MNLKITIRHKKENKYMRTKLIFSPQLAQYLLREGFTIVELKPKKNTVNETVFVFRVDEGFSEAIDAWMADK